jgi:hypothetical protein
VWRRCGERRYEQRRPYRRSALFRYLDEQAFRFNNREDLDDRGRFDLAVSQIVAKRLTYTGLIGKGQPETRLN